MTHHSSIAKPSFSTLFAKACRKMPVPQLMPVAIHLVLFIIFTCTFLYNIAWNLQRGGIVITEWIYLTHWNLTFQVIFCTVELLSDFSVRFAERVVFFRAKLFHTVVMPFCFFVFSFFWCLCAIDENLVRSSDPGKRFEEWYNQVVHTLIVPAVLLQSMASYHKPPPLVVSFTITIVCGFMYICWAAVWGLLLDWWAYNLFRILSLSGWLLMMLVSAVIIGILQTAGRVAHQAVWRVRRL